MPLLSKSNRIVRYYMLMYPKGDRPDKGGEEGRREEGKLGVYNHGVSKGGWESWNEE